jgi:hypothetical protein
MNQMKRMFKRVSMFMQIAKQYAKHWFWFLKESYSYMQDYNKPWIINKLWITFYGIQKAFGFAKLMCQWDHKTAEQQEQWYLSGEGRTITFGE